jgi:hypothetical protein
MAPLNRAPETDRTIPLPKVVKVVEPVISAVPATTNLLPGVVVPTPTFAPLVT